MAEENVRAETQKALLEAIKSEVGGDRYNLKDLAEAYSLIIFGGRSNS